MKSKDEENNKIIERSENFISNLTDLLEKFIFQRRGRDDNFR